MHGITCRIVRAFSLAGMMGLVGSSNAAFIYDCSTLTPGTVPAPNESPVPAGTSFQGTTTIGETASLQDNWVWTSSTSNVNGSIVRNDIRQGMSGNYLSAYSTASPATGAAAPSPFDSINSRKNTASGFNYSIPNGSKFSISFICSISGFVYNNSGSSTTSRAEVAMGYDQNNDGDIRGDASATINENAEWGPTFGFEPAASPTSPTTGLVGRWYYRPPNLGTAIQANALGAGVYKIQLEVDPTARPVTGGFDGSGTITIQQLFDANGNVGSGLLPSIPSLTDFNMGLTRMNTVASGGTAGGWNPANWNGFMTRLSNGGALDSIEINVVPEPTCIAMAFPAFAAMVRRRRH